MGNILIINAGSSSVKFSVFAQTGGELILNETIDRLADVTEGIKLIPSILKERNIANIRAVGHRVVHGGTKFSAPVIVNAEILTKLRNIYPLAPLHQPYNVKAIEVFTELMPNVPQVACFDTAFHANQPKIHKIMPLPHKLYNEGIMRYGFHGLSYQYIASVLPKYCGQKAYGKVIVAHLGNGSSICAMDNLKSSATSMGFSTLDGLMMGTRTGSLDPGVLLYLMQEKNYKLEDLERLLYKESGLFGVAGINSKDMRDIIASDNENAKIAFELFCLIAARNLASLAACIKGLDVIVFTAGIGERSAIVRKNICKHLAWLGVELDSSLNEQNSIQTSSPASKVGVYVIPTNEEASILEEVQNLT